MGHSTWISSLYSAPIILYTFENTESPFPAMAKNAISVNLILLSGVFNKVFV